MGDITCIYICLSDLQRECGGILNGTVGIIQSSPFDSKGRYENLISCSWVIVVPEEEAVFFEFETIDVEYDATCSKDYIQVRLRECIIEMSLDMLFPRWYFDKCRLRLACAACF